MDRQVPPCLTAAGNVVSRGWEGRRHLPSSCCAYVRALGGKKWEIRRMHFGFIAEIGLQLKFATETAKQS